MTPLTIHKGPLTETVTGWWYERGDHSVGIWEGVVHDCESPYVVNLQYSHHNITSRKNGQVLMTVLDVYECDCGAVLLWEYEDWDVDDSISEDGK